jgi:hypothetical protein
LHVGNDRRILAGVTYGYQQLPIWVAEMTLEMAPHRKAVAPRRGGPGGVKGERAHGRSRLSNMVGRLPDVDRRTAVGRRFHDITRALTIDAGAIAADNYDLPEAKRQLIRRFAGASVIAEMMEAKLAAGQEINISEHAQLCSVLVRLSQRIGIDRAMREIEDDASLVAEYERALHEGDAPDATEE